MHENHEFFIGYIESAKASIPVLAVHGAGINDDSVAISRNRRFFVGRMPGNNSERPRMLRVLQIIVSDPE